MSLCFQLGSGALLHIAMAQQMTDTDLLDIEESLATSYGDIKGSQIHNVPLNMVTTKVPPAYDGTSMTWFQYEDKLYDWEDIIEIDEKSRGPMCRSRLYRYSGT